MKETKNFKENKLATTMGEISFTGQEIMVQCDVKNGQIVNMLVVEIDQ